MIEKETGFQKAKLGLLSLLTQGLWGLEWDKGCFRSFPVFSPLQLMVTSNSALMDEGAF